MKHLDISDLVTGFTYKSLITDRLDTFQRVHTITVTRNTGKTVFWTVDWGSIEHSAKVAQVLREIPPRASEEEITAALEALDTRQAVLEVETFFRKGMAQSLKPEQVKALQKLIKSF